MNWILAGFLMFLSSVITYLLVRAASLRNISGAMQNVAMFSIPLFVFVPLAIVSQSGLGVTLYQLFLLVLSGILFSYFGSKWSVISLKYAPNPGYSLILSKSYVVFTAIVAVLFFGAELTTRAIVAIISILAFSSLIMIDRKKDHRKDVKSIWILYAFGAFFCWGMLAIVSKYLLEIGVSVYARLIYVMGIACILFVRDAQKEIVSLKIFIKKDWMIFVGLGLFSGAFNYFTQVGYATAPNIGYINALNAASIAFVTIGARIFFHDEFTLRKFIGVVGVVFGLMLLVL